MERQDNQSVSLPWKCPVRDVFVVCMFVTVGGICGIFGREMIPITVLFAGIWILITFTVNLLINVLMRKLDGVDPYQELE